MQIGSPFIRQGKFSFPRSKTKTGATNIDNGVITIPLDKNWLVKEETVRVVVTQTFGGLVPTSFDVRRFFSRLQLDVDQGKGIKANFPLFYDLGRVTENTPAPIITLGATSTAEFTFDIHHLNDGALFDLITAQLSGKYSTRDLILTCAGKADNGFIGGTVPGEASYSIEVMPFEMREATPFPRNDTSGNWGKAEHSQWQQAALAGGVAGLAAADMPFTAGGKMRFALLHAYDAAAAGNLTDAVFNNGARITFEVDGHKYYDNTALSSIKLDNIRNRTNLGVGAVLLDFGDDPMMWPDLRNVKNPKATLDIPASASLPAAWRLEYCQDYTIGMELLPGPLHA